MRQNKKKNKKIRTRRTKTKTKTKRTIECRYHGVLHCSALTHAAVFMPLSPLKNDVGGIMYSGLSVVSQCVSKSARPENVVNSKSQ